MPEQYAQHDERRPGRGQRPCPGDPGPAEEPLRAGPEAEQEPAAADLLHRRGGHGQLADVHRVRVHDRDAQADPAGAGGQRSGQHRRGAQEQVVGHPQLVEARLLRRLGQREQFGEAQVVVHPHREPHVGRTHASTTAWASISTGKPSPISPAT